MVTLVCDIRIQKGFALFSVRTYLILMNVIVLCLLFPTASGYYWNKITELRDVQLNNTISSHRTSMEAKGTLVVQSMSLSIHEAIAGFDFSFVNTLISQVVAQDNELQQCMLIDLQGQVFAHNDHTQVGSIFKQPDDEKLNYFTNNHNSTTTVSITTIEILYSLNKMMFVGSPVFNGTNLWGVLRCGYTTRVLDEKIQTTRDHWQKELISIRDTFLSFTFLFFIVAVLFSLLFTAKFVRAIEKLKLGVSQFSNGDLTHKIKSDELLVNEFRMFADHFNQMTQKLNDSRIKLDEYNQSLENTVKLRTRELEDTNEELKAFSYSVSHDLRAPLRAINGIVTALVEDCSDGLSECGKQYVARIQYSSKKMDELISGMLKLSRIGQSEIEKIQLNFSSIATNCIAELHRDQPNMQTEIRVQPDLTVVGDYKMIPIVIDNLISNAWKYSSKNEIISIEIGALTENPDVFYIKDNGVGFDMQYVEKLFLPFRRLHSWEEFEGTGIGLATVARIINRHSGKIWVESEVGKGTTFFFTFTPLETAI